MYHPKLFWTTPLGRCDGARGAPLRGVALTPRRSNMHGGFPAGLKICFWGLDMSAGVAGMTRGRGGGRGSALYHALCECCGRVPHGGTEAQRVELRAPHALFGGCEWFLNQEGRKAGICGGVLPGSQLVIQLRMTRMSCFAGACVAEGLVGGDAGEDADDSPERARHTSPEQRPGEWG